MSEPTKICTDCKVSKPVTEFKRKTKNKDGLHSWCETCHDKRHKSYQKKYCHSQKGKRARQRWRRDNPEKHDRMLLKSQLKRLYDMTLEQYDTMLEEQNGTCAICNGTETSKNKKYLAVDHDHMTGKVRGLLCSSCNCLLGYARDNLSILNAAKEYLDNG